MKPSELIHEIRIGIYLQSKKYGSIFSVCEHTITDEHFWEDVVSGNIIPIPISENWLEDLGFSKIQENIYIDKKGVALFHSKSTYTTHLIKIKYIHQLQNVYLVANNINLISEKHH